MNRLNLVDRWSFLATCALSILGILFIRSATMEQTNILWFKQTVWFGGGLVFYFIMSQFDYKKMVSHANHLYILGILSLILVLLFGHKINGARSWFRLPFMSFQPSEFLKIVICLVSVKYFSKFQSQKSSLWEFIVSSILVGIPFVLIVLQPDFGTALVYLPLFVIPNFLTGKKEGIWVTVGGVVVVAILIAGVVLKPNWVFFLKNYQKARIVSFIYPDEDTSNKGYQVHQSKISIGQGGLFGMGLGKGKQTHLGFLPAQYNDFILAVAAEETGFLGIFFIFCLYLIIYLRGFVTALEAQDAMGSCLVVLVVGTLVTQTLFNASMLVGLAPTTGIPCPLLSYGGSSYLTTMGLLGLIQSVRTHRFVNH